MSLWLVKCGVPYDVAFSLNDTDKLAYTIIMGQFEGNEWDWSRMHWVDK